MMIQDNYLNLISIISYYIRILFSIFGLFLIIFNCSTNLEFRSKYSLIQLKNLNISSLNKSFCLKNLLKKCGKINILKYSK